MPRIVLPPDAFEDMPEGYCWSSEPDDDRPEHEFPEWDEYLERCELDARYDAEERFAELMGLNERAVGA